MSLDAETIKKLRDLAEAATPGPWEARTFLIKGGDKMRDTICHVGTSTSLGPARAHESEANAALMAAANPAVILSLIDALEAERSGTEAMRKALETLLRGIDQSRWHDVNGEKMKRVLVAPTAIDRLRAAALSTPNPGDADGCIETAAAAIYDVHQSEEANRLVDWQDIPNDGFKDLYRRMASAAFAVRSQS